MTKHDASPSDKRNPTASAVNPAPSKPISEAAARALAEAAERRAVREREAAAKPKELHGRQGPDPARYGDWENKGIASDF